MTDRFAQIILPQPGSDWKAYALSLNAQLSRLIQQLARIQSTDLGGGGGSYTLPISNSSGRLIIDADGNIVDENGNIIIDATGLHVLDINDFKWIDGPNVYIDTEKLVDNAITTAKLAAQAVTADKFYGNLEPIEIVPSLPNPSGYTGPSVVLYNGKVYRYDTGAWTANVDTTDLAGTITETQIADDSISTPKLQTNSVKAAQIDAGAIITDKLDAGAVTAAKLAAYSVVAGKIAANAIVAGDAVIGAAAIVDAMIANLNASKINAGDIAAQRMEANIVTALVGKFAVLSAIVSILGTVTIGASGYLRTQGVTSATAGTGIYLGDNGSGVYVLRVGSSTLQFKWDGTKLVLGNPTGGRWEFSGSSGVFYDNSGNVLFASTNSASDLLNSQQAWSQINGASDSGNLLPDVNFADPAWVYPSDAVWSLQSPPSSGLPGATALQYDEQTKTPSGSFISEFSCPSGLRFPVTPGEQIYWSYWMKSASGTNGTAAFMRQFYDISGALMTEPSGDDPALPVTYPGTFRSGAETVPANAVKMGFRLRRGASPNGATTNGWVQWSQIRFSRTQDGATVGAPAGTYVGTQLAESLVADAATAMADADTANALLTDIASDSKLTASEKQQTKVEWDGLVAEKSGIEAQATAFGITTEKTAYINAYNTLSSYITPLLAGLSTTSSIVGATFRTNFSTLYAARQALLNKTADEASKRATWSSVTGAGKPEDGATVGADIGTNLTRSGTSVLASEFIAAWNKLSEGNAGTFMSTAAITSAYIKDAAILNAKIQDGAITTAKIGDAQVDTLQIGNNAVTVPLYSEVASTAYASRGTYQVTIGSITTSSAGQGNVIVMVFPRGPFPDLSVSYAYVAAAIAHRYSGSSGTHYLRLLRVVGASTTEVWRWEYTSAPSSSTTFAEGPVIFDTPGPGVSVVYKLESGGPTGNTMMKPLSVVLLEAKK